jgi:diguanylate cyclase (GGDEF)-like protein
VHWTTGLRIPTTRHRVFTNRRFALERPARSRSKQALPYNLAGIMLIPPSGGRGFNSSDSNATRHNAHELGTGRLPGTEYASRDGEGFPEQDGSMMASTSSDGLQVIVVEDDPASREILCDVVRGLGHGCRSACDGRDAWKMHQAHRADLIIADWQMPLMDGLELCRKVREEETALPWHTHFILATGRSDRQFVEGLRGGADEYVTKPVELEELEARIEAAWRVTKVHRELQTRNRALRLDSARNHRAARTDPLTSVFNRLRLEEDLATLEGRGSRYGHRYCAALCDVDEFKAYNDGFGHLAGDEALCRIARTTQKQLRSGDSLYRYGGDEFLIILPEQTLADAKLGVERVRQQIETLGIQHAPTAPSPVLTISAGIAELGAGPISDWLLRADAALYQAKRLGRNRVKTEDCVASLGGLFSS